MLFGFRVYRNYVGINGSGQHGGERRKIFLKLSVIISVILFDFGANQNVDMKVKPLKVDLQLPSYNSSHVRREAKLTHQ